MSERDREIMRERERERESRPKSPNVWISHYGDTFWGYTIDRAKNRNHLICRKIGWTIFYSSNFNREGEIQQKRQPQDLSPQYGDILNSFIRI